MSHWVVLDHPTFLHHPPALSFCPTLLPHPPSPPFCPTLLPHPPSPPFCPTLLPHPPSPPFCPTLLPHPSAPPSCPTLLPLDATQRCCYWKTPAPCECVSVCALSSSWLASSSQVSLHVSVASSPQREPPTPVCCDEKRVVVHAHPPGRPPRPSALPQVPDPTGPTQCCAPLGQRLQHTHAPSHTGGRGGAGWGGGKGGEGRSGEVGREG